MTAIWLTVYTNLSSKNYLKEIVINYLPLYLIVLMIQYVQIISELTFASACISRSHTRTHSHAHSRMYTQLARNRWPRDTPQLIPELQYLYFASKRASHSSARPSYFDVFRVVTEKLATDIFQV